MTRLFRSALGVIASVLFAMPATANPGSTAPPSEQAALQALADAEAGLKASQAALATARARLDEAVHRVRRARAAKAKSKVRPGGRPAGFSDPDDPFGDGPGVSSEGEQLEKALMDSRVSTPAVDRLRRALAAAEARFESAERARDAALADLEALRRVKADPPAD